MNINDLKKEIPYKWRVQSFSKFKPEATCVAYIDARQAMDLLDEVVGPENWQDKYIDIDGQLFCQIGIKVGGDWVWKSDTGTESNMEKQKGQVSDAFKRAAVKWGVGRFLYSLEMIRIGASEKKVREVKSGKVVSENYPYVVNNQGKRIYDLTKYINEKVLGISQGPSQEELFNKASEKLEKVKTLEELSQWAIGIKGKFEGPIKQIAIDAYHDCMYGILIDIVDTCKTPIAVENFQNSHDDYISKLPESLKDKLTAYCAQISLILTREDINIDIFTVEIDRLETIGDIEKWKKIHSRRVEYKIGKAGLVRINEYAEKRIKELNRSK